MDSAPALRAVSVSIYPGFGSRKLRQGFACILGGTRAGVCDHGGLCVLPPQVGTLRGEEGSEDRRPPPRGSPRAQMGQEQSVGTCPGTGRAARPPAERARGQKAGRWECRAQSLPLAPARSPRPAASDPPGIRTKGSERRAPALQNSFRETDSPHVGHLNARVSVCFRFSFLTSRSTEWETTFPSRVAGSALWRSGRALGQRLRLLESSRGPALGFRRVPDRMGI